MAINAMLDEIDSDECRRIRFIGAQTDRFRKVRKMEYFPEERSIAGTRHQPLYTELLRAVNRLDNEDFRAVRDVVEDYFRSGPDFKEVFETLHAALTTVRSEKPLAELKEAAAALDKVIPDDLREKGSGSDSGRLAKFGKNCRSCPLIIR